MEHFELKYAVLCVECNHVSKATGEVCPVCGAKGTLLSLARLMEGRTKQGEITYFRRAI